MNTIFICSLPKDNQDLRHKLFDYLQVMNIIRGESDHLGIVDDNLCFIGDSDYIKNLREYNTDLEKSNIAAKDFREGYLTAQRYYEKLFFDSQK